LIYPDNPVKTAWDIYITLILIIACITTPINIAFSYKKEDLSTTISNYFMDCMFLIDIIINFNSAYITPTLELVEDHGTICKTYAKGWFSIDVIAIIPFDLMIPTASADELEAGTADYSNLAKVARFGRLYKLVKLTKLLRILKVMKDESKLLQFFNSMGSGF